MSKVDFNFLALSKEEDSPVLDIVRGSTVSFGYI